MFGAPPTLKTEVFASIPVEFRQAGKLSQERIQAGKGTLKRIVLLKAHRLISLEIYILSILPLAG